MTTEELFYTPLDIADLLKVSYMTVYRWIKSRKLNAIKAGKQYRIKRADLDIFLEGRKLPVKG